MDQHSVSREKPVSKVIHFRSLQVKSKGGEKMSRIWFRVVFILYPVLCQIRNHQQNVFEKASSTLPSAFQIQDYHQTPGKHLNRK